MTGPRITLSACAKTDRGLAREGNEDAFYFSASDGVFIVADGMGGHLAGSVASNTAVQVISGVLGEQLDPRIENRTSERAQAAIESAVAAANKAIFARSERDAALQGMGTTCVSAVFAGEHFVVGHVGDSRAYLFRGGASRQLTVDHSLLADAARHSRDPRQELRFSYLRNVITKAIGPSSEVEAESHIHRAEDKDVLLLCTDGLSNYVTPEEMAELVNAGKGLGATCDALIDKAKLRQSDDNITAVLVSVGVVSSRHREKASGIKHTKT